jgi:predicted Rossmann fold flavoprotein
VIVFIITLINNKLKRKNMSRVLIIGGGAAGYFAAANMDVSEDVQVQILEKSNKVLAKVKVSGGGRCNVTHACFEPKELVKFYPRGSKELIGPFTRFQPGDIFAWFEDRGVALKTESDNRVFPTTDSSQTIIDCLELATAKKNTRISLQSGITRISGREDKWFVEIEGKEEVEADAVIIAGGSSPLMWDILSELGLQMIDQVPSLFTFNIKDKRIDGFAGLSSAYAHVSIENSKFDSYGPMLITHWGLSGPGILKLSALAARELNNWDYRFKIKVNWLANEDFESVMDTMKRLRDDQPKKAIFSFSPFEIPLRLWISLCSDHITEQMKWADASNKALEHIANNLTRAIFEVNGKSTFKDEFVTSGGVDLTEINFKTMEAKRFQGLYFAGEVLNIDAVTGGFNFQAAWTTSWIAAKSISEKLHSQKSF